MSYVSQYEKQTHRTIDFAPPSRGMYAHSYAPYTAQSDTDNVFSRYFYCVHICTYDASMHPPPYLLLIDPWQGKKEMLMTLVKHPRNSHPEMDSPFKIPSKYAR